MSDKSPATANRIRSCHPDFEGRIINYFHVCANPVSEETISIGEDSNLEGMNEGMNEGSAFHVNILAIPSCRLAFATARLCTNNQIRNCYCYDLFVDKKIIAIKYIII